MSPALPENAKVVIDVDGVSFALGQNGDWRPNWWYDYTKKVVAPKDLSDADTIEFDIYYSNYDAFMEYMKSNGYILGFNVTSSGDAWVDRSAAAISAYETELGNGWYHYAVPKAAFSAKQNNGVDWTKVNTFHLFCEGGDAGLGALCSEIITVANVCGTSSKPAMSSNSVATIYADSKTRTLGDHGAFYLSWLYGRLCVENLPTADLTNADYIEFDIHYSDYDAIMSHANTDGTAFRLSIGSYDSIWLRRSDIPITNYGVAVGGGWYHYVVPKADFIARGDHGAVDWASVNNWFLIGEGGTQTELNSLHKATITVSNICGTVAPAAPTAPTGAVVLDADGVSKMLGDNGAWNTGWWEGRFCNYALTAVDFSNVDFIEFDIHYSDYNAFIAYNQNNGLDLIINLTSSGSPWSYRSQVNLLNYGTELGYGWYHYRVPKSVFAAQQNGGVDWSKVDSWFLYEANAKQVAFGDICSDTLTLKNLCGTTIESIAPKAPSNSMVVIDEEGMSGILGPNGDWRPNWWNDLYRKAITPVDLSNADCIEFDIHYSNYDAFMSYLETNGYALGFNVTSSGDAWVDRSAAAISAYETELGNGWYHYAVPKSVFTARQNNGVDWSNVNIYHLFSEGGDAPLGSLCTETITIVNVHGTTYKLENVTDGYSIVAAGTDIDVVANDNVKVYNADGITLAEGVVATGMTVKFEAKGWIYDKATVVVENDVDADGAVTATDLTLAKKFYFDAATATEIQNVALTGSKTATASILDYIQLKNALLG